MSGDQVEQGIEQRFVGKGLVEEAVGTFLDGAQGGGLVGEGGDDQDAGLRQKGR